MLKASVIWPVMSVVAITDSRHSTEGNRHTIAAVGQIRRAIVALKLGRAPQKVLQFQSLGTLIATSGCVLPGVVGLAPDMGLAAAIGLTGIVLERDDRCCSPFARPAPSVGVAGEMLPRTLAHVWNSPKQWLQTRARLPRGL